MKEYGVSSYYYITENDELFGITYKCKEKAIQVYLKHIENEESMDSDYWKEHAKKHRDNISNGKVKIMTITKHYEVDTKEELLEV